MRLRRVSQDDFPLSLAEGKSQCRIAPAIDYFDTEIQHLIEAATGKVSNMTGLVLAEETWELTVSRPRGCVSLQMVPVVALVSVNGSADISGYTLAIEGDCASVSGDWPEGEAVIVFKAGGNVPAELKHAILLLVSQWFRDREATGEAVSELPYAVEALVADHRRGWVKA